MRSRRALARLWASPNTLLGLVLVGLSALVRGRARVVDGVLEAHGPALEVALRALANRPRAVTLGHVVLGVSRAALDETRAHERVHVAQYERWGPLFLPAYLISSALCLCRGLDAYRDNVFEREAFEADEVHERGEAGVAVVERADDDDAPRAP